MDKALSILYFSATGTTKKIVKHIADEITLNTEGIRFNQEYDITLPKSRETRVTFSKNEVVILGLPVYAGRVPNVLVNYLKTLISNGGAVIPIVVYGNRNQDDALVELKDILESDGFKVIGCGAFIGEHSFSRILAKGRPDEKDLTIASEFAEKIREKVIQNEMNTVVGVRGVTPYRKHYVPIDPNGDPVDLRRVKPKTRRICTDCKICVALCPMGSINPEDVKVVNGICIKCGTCIKNCPVSAKYFDDENYLRHKEELERAFFERREPEVFI